MATESRRLEWLTSEYPFEAGETLLAYITRVCERLAPGYAVTEAGAQLRYVDVSTWSELNCTPGGAWAEVVRVSSG